MPDPHVQIDDTTPLVRYTVGGTPQSVFVIPFAFFDEDEDISVYIGGSTTPLPAEDYSVTGTAGYSRGFPGGTLTLDTAVSNTTVAIESDLPIERTSDHPVSGALDINTLNTDLDRYAVIAKQLHRDIRRSVRGPNGDDFLDAMPNATGRALRALWFDADGQPVLMPNGALPSEVGNGYTIETRAAISVTNIPAPINVIQTLGYAAVGDGGGTMYVRTGSAPAHFGEVSLDGAHWALASKTQNIQALGVTFDAVTDDIDQWNLVAAALNDGALRDVILPYGTSLISDEIDPIVSNGFGWRIRGPGAVNCTIQMTGSHGRCFKFGTNGVGGIRCNQGRIQGFNIRQANTANQSATDVVLDFCVASDIYVEDVWTSRSAGFTRLGRNDNEPDTANRIRFLQCRAILNGPTGGKAFEFLNVGNIRIAFFSQAIDGIAATTYRGIHCHPSGLGRVLDSVTFYGCEFNAPGAEVDRPLEIDASNGPVTNFFFTDCVFDHYKEAGITIKIAAGAAANGRLANIQFNHCRTTANTIGSDAAVCVETDNTGNKEFTNVQFNGGTLNGLSEVSVRMLGNNYTGLSFNGVGFTDQQGLVARPVIETACQGLVVSGCRVQDRGSSSGFPAFTYLVAATHADAKHNMVVGNDCDLCTVGIVDLSTASVVNRSKWTVQGNKPPTAAGGQRVSSVTTTDATVTTLLEQELESQTTYIVEATVIGIQDSTNRAVYVRRAMVYRLGLGSVLGGGGVSAVFTDESDAAWDCTLDVTGNNVRVRVTGAAATTIKWYCEQLRMVDGPM